MSHDSKSLWLEKSPLFNHCNLCLWQKYWHGMNSANLWGKPLKSICKLDFYQNSYKKINPCISNWETHLKNDFISTCTCLTHSLSVNPLCWSGSWSLYWEHWVQCKLVRLCATCHTPMMPTNYNLWLWRCLGCSQCVWAWYWSDIHNMCHVHVTSL